MRQEWWYVQGSSTIIWGVEFKVILHREVMRLAWATGDCVPVSKQTYLPNRCGDSKYNLCPLEAEAG